MSSDCQAIIEKNNARNRSWFLTINNPESNELYQHKTERYAAWQIEKGQNGTEHIQAVIHLSNAISFSAIKKVYPTAHIEVCHDLKASIAYCKKEESRVHGPWERGEPPKQGKRNDIIDAVECLKENLGKRKPFKAVCEQYPEVAMKFHKGLHFVANQLVEDRTESPEVYVYIGSTGTGKSSFARKWLPEAWVWNPAKDKWFDGYLGQVEAIFEEYRGQLPYASMLSVLDRYTHEHQIKGGMIDFVAKRIAITSPMHPLLWYPRQAESERTDSIKQLLRRITKVFYCKGPDSVPEEISKETLHVSMD